MPDLTKFQYTLLSIIHDEDGVSGQDIRREIEDGNQYDIDVVNHGRLYPNLDVLVEEKLVKKSAYDERTNKYVPTERAEEVLASRSAVLTPNK